MGETRMGAASVVVVMIYPFCGLPCCRVGVLGDGRATRDLGKLHYFCSFGQNSFKNAQEIANLRARDNERRQQADGEIVRAIDEQAMLQRGSDQRRAINGEFHAEDETLAADFADEIKFLRESFKALAQFGATFANIREELGAFDGFQKFQSGGADQRSTAEGGAVNARGYACGDGFAGEDGAERKTGGERLGDEHNVRLARELLVGEVTAGASEAALNFVGNEQCAVLRGQGACAIPESFRNRVNAAFALDGFEDYRANGVVKFRFEVGDVIKLYEFDAGDHRREGQAIFFRGGDADGAEGATVEGILHGQNAMFRRDGTRGQSFRAGVQAREF